MANIKNVISPYTTSWRWDTVENSDEKIKYEVITELGLFEKVKLYGWKSLTAKETGRIGGLITKKKRILQLEKGQ
jgi:small acid-soluble spore protein F (minor alpha/beta-type SASP)